MPNLRYEAALKLSQSEDPIMADMARHYLQMTDVLLRAEEMTAKFKAEMEAFYPQIEGLRDSIKETRREAVALAAKSGIPEDVAFAIRMNSLSCQVADDVLIHLWECKACFYTTSLLFAATPLVETGD